MKIEVATPEGATLSFEGADDELETFISFVENDASRLLGALGAPTTDVVSDGQDDPHSNSAAGRKSIHDLQRRLDEVEANTDTERLAVMAQFALDTGADGLAPETAEMWYTQLGIPKPGRMRSTFGNAKTRGYIHHAATGWRPTTAGENFARHGIRRQSSRRRGSRLGATPDRD